MRYLHTVLCILAVTAVNAAELSDTIKAIPSKGTRCLMWL